MTTENEVSDIAGPSPEEIQADELKETTIRGYLRASKKVDRAWAERIWEKQVEVLAEQKKVKITKAGGEARKLYDSLISEGRAEEEARTIANQLFAELSK